MKTPRTRHGIATVLAGVLALATPAWAQQDALTRAKSLYASASYEDALQVLAAAPTPGAPTEAREIAAYQFFCLVALGRDDEAKHTIETIVKIDPLYHPSAAQVSPRVLAFFEDVRRPLLPTIVQDSYAEAKGAFEKKEMPAAAKVFDRVIALIDEMGASQGPGSSDMRTLASGFRDLAKAAAAPPPPPAAPAAPAVEPARLETAAKEPASAAPPPAPEPAVIYSVENVDVVKPVAVERELPEFKPANTFEATQTFRGTLELVIDEHGKVISAAILKSIRPAYDPLLLKAAQDWTFRPATKHGVPVKYSYRMNVQVGR